MPASYYWADSENGDGIDDSFEEALFMLIEDLDHADNTFVVVQPDSDDPAWFASIATLDEGGCEVVLCDTRRHVHDLTVEQNIGRIVKDLTIWMADPQPQLTTNTSATHGVQNRPKAAARCPGRTRQAPASILLGGCSRPGGGGHGPPVRHHDRHPPLLSLLSAR
ncbi:hypothetical protein KDK95_18120 [Actinospica sp. MGRD01-02]|uniref:Uncharacterized protein n=1 Tax=Actinospica acidithermotolerans TaxID=2828514 RepID=A0A941IM48_9ACTN|nr:hypothetical protein [Actinospica acidithermotolerans]MBR7828236.1 hypothetical protein [Actinospica acidithermotolerans]